MCLGYDPFKYADAYSSEEEYFKELEEDNKITKIEINLNEITSKLDELKDAQARCKFELKNVEKEIEKEELKLIALLDKTQCETMDYGVYSFGWKTTTRKVFDQKLFGQENPDLLEKYRIEKENRVFEFKINK